MLKHIIIVAMCFLGTGAKEAHQDRLLKLHENGFIEGLPEQYSPAFLDLETQTLRIGQRIVKLPNCMSHYYHSVKNPVVLLSASWYHSQKVLPYYKNYKVREIRQDYEYQSLLGLDSLEVIQTNIIIHGNNNSYRIHRLERDSSCLDEYEKAIELVE